jgi:hypothetical protein
MTARVFRMPAVAVAALALCCAPLARSQPAPGPSGPKKISILIDDFEAMDPSTAWKYHKAAPEILLAALSTAFAGGRRIEVSFVEREKLTSILKENSLPEKLPRTFDQKTVTALQAARADYVVFAQYQRVKTDSFRITARLTKVETATAPVAVQASFLDEDKEPFRDLADQLKTALYKALQIAVAEQHFTLVVCRFEPNPPNEKIPPFLDERLLGRLQGLHLSGITLVAPDIVDCRAPAVAGPAASAASAFSELRVTGVLRVDVDAAGRRHILLLIKISHAVRGLAACFTKDSEEGTLTVDLQQAADELSREWEIRAVEWAEGSSGPQ